MKLQVNGTCAPALFVYLRERIGLLRTGIKAGHNTCLKLDSNPWFQCLPSRQWATALLLELLYARGLSTLSESCCVCINMTGHERKQGNEHNFFSLFSVGVTGGHYSLFKPSPPRPPAIFLSIIVLDTLQHWKGNTQQFSEGLYLSPISFEALDMRNGVCVFRCYLHCAL